MVILFIAAIIPNSFIISAFVKTNVPKPIAVVALVKKVALPTFPIVRESAFALFP